MTSEANGTQTASISTEHTLSGSSFTTAGTYVLLVNLTNLTGGATPDIVELRVKVKVLTGGSEVTAYSVSYVGGLNVTPVAISVPVPSLYSIAFTLKQTQGTGRNFEWNVLTL